MPNHSLSNSRTNLFGEPPRRDGEAASPGTFGSPFTGVGGGGSRMTVDQRRFQSLSRLGALEHVQGIEDRLLQNREQREFMQQKIRARAGGAEITKALTGLDPRAPDYLEQRNRILVSNPDAILDPRTKDLVGLYDEVYATTDERRKRGEGAIINQNENIRQENAAVTKDVLKMEGGKKTARETKDDEFYDSLDPTSRGFAQDRLGVYEVASVEELPEGKKEQFRREVRDFDNNQKVEVALIEGGFPPDALDGMKKASPTGYLEPIQVAKANAALAKRNSEATRIQKKIDAVDKRIQTLEDQSNPGAAERIRKGEKDALEKEQRELFNTPLVPTPGGKAPASGRAWKYIQDNRGAAPSNESREDPRLGGASTTPRR